MNQSIFAAVASIISLIFSLFILFLRKYCKDKAIINDFFISTMVIFIVLNTILWGYTNFVIDYTQREICKDYDHGKIERIIIEKKANNVTIEQDTIYQYIKNK